eukprot:CAMPEP_0202915030 /NCGR_PEP_ID=MMETSP1392-20130828/64698_1 /ASSEMBLY_ACC=CAM_ASM_000868 /TAXON_ID=225041 /ORGANISM="Chlamydomonas chlamydogama, Strain SAG 11-48b" /LENGTH=52 /DNA_ID=CAMNT_0049606917 /DNA_START=152 /DNA_END=306 /DNA_ORIENTATION=-
MGLDKHSVRGFLCAAGKGKGGAMKAEAGNECKGRIVQTNYLEGMLRKKKSHP